MVANHETVSSNLTKNTSLPSSEAERVAYIYEVGISKFSEGTTQGSQAV